MNTRRKMFGGIVFAAAALLTLSGCRKDEGGKVVLSAEFEQPAGGQKTYINDHSVCWTEGDEVRVNDATTAVAVSDGAVEVEANGNGYAVVYPFASSSTLSGSGKTCTGGSVEIPAEQEYTLTPGGQQKMSSPMAARLDSRNGKLYFKNLHSLIRVDVTTVNEAFVLESITITSSTANLAGTLGFRFQTGGTTAAAASAPELGNLTDPEKSVTLNFDEPITLAAHTIERAFYLCVAPFTSTDLEIKVTGKPQGGDKAGKKGSYVFNRSGKSLDRSIMAEVKANFGDATFVPESSEPEEPEPEPGPFKFSVSSTLQVEFSPGNLQWSATGGGSTQTTHAVAGGGTAAGTWRFAEHQWDYVGDATNGTVKEGGVKCSNTQIAQNYTGWIDLFGWGTSGWQSGATQYQPYATSKTNSEYCPGGAGTNNLTGTYANADWGVYNAIYNPQTKKTDAAGTWRTLTNAEWAYLLGATGSARTITHSDWWIYNTVTIEKADGINDVSGLIIYPDEVTKDITGKLPNKCGKNGTSITAAEFAALEAKGCVFLPVAGGREGTSLILAGTTSSAGSSGYYYSSTYLTDKIAHSLGFSKTNVTPQSTGYRYRGCSVRLVKDIN